jgi:hypothetical protein
MRSEKMRDDCRGWSSLSFYDKKRKPQIGVNGFPSVYTELLLYGYGATAKIDIFWNTQARCIDFLIFGRDDDRPDAENRATSPKNVFPAGA